MTRPYALCPGAGLDYCANCQRNADNQPEASKDPHQAWIPETSNDHCAYFREEPAR